MPRKQSPETQVRHLKRELKDVRRELSRRIIVGYRMSNLCFYLSQDDLNIDRLYYKKLYDEWDAIVRAR